MTIGKLGHPEGEVILTRGAKKHNVIQMIPTLASCSFDEIVDAKQGDQAQWLQLYVNKDRAITERIIKHAEKRGCRALFITVDAPQVRIYPQALHSCPRPKLGDEKKCESNGSPKSQDTFCYSGPYIEEAMLTLKSVQLGVRPLSNFHQYHFNKRLASRKGYSLQIL